MQIMKSKQRTEQQTKRQIRVVVLGETGVGTTSFADRFLVNDQFALYSPWDTLQTEENNHHLPKRRFQVDEEFWDIQVDDICLTSLRLNPEGFAEDIISNILQNATGFVLLYDVTDILSYEYVTSYGYRKIMKWRKTETEDGENYAAGGQGFGCVLVGNKIDILAKEGEGKRQVRKSLADEWAGMHGMRHFEVDTHTRDPIDEIMRVLMKNVKRVERWDKEDMEKKTKKSESISGLSRSFSRLRHALPLVSSNSSKGKGKQKEEPPWSMYFPARSASGPSTQSEQLPS